MITKDDLDWWSQRWQELTWTFASTMPDAPHSYMVRERTMDAQEFDRAVKVIRTFGEPGKFYGRTNIYLTIGDRKWWTMGAPLEETIIINMATTDQVYGTQDAPSTASDHFTVYDSLATVYDDRYTDPEDIRENQAIRRLIRKHFGAYAPTTLDVGCGTGLLLDMKITAASLYEGVDPSQGMLNELIRKHPKVTQVHACTAEESLGRLTQDEYELVVSLFGSPSYIDPDTIRRLPTLSSSMTVMMHYVKGYLPDYHNNDPDLLARSDASREAALSLPNARHYTLNNFVVTVCDG